jgi:hypothetical protein
MITPQYTVDADLTDLAEQTRGIHKSIHLVSWPVPAFYTNELDRVIFGSSFMKPTHSATEDLNMTNVNQIGSTDNFSQTPMPEHFFPLQDLRGRDVSSGQMRLPNFSCPADTESQLAVTSRQVTTGQKYGKCVLKLKVKRCVVG